MRGQPGVDGRGVEPPAPGHAAGAANVAAASASRLLSTTIWSAMAMGNGVVAPPCACPEPPGLADPGFSGRPTVCSQSLPSSDAFWV